MTTDTPADKTPARRLDGEDIERMLFERFRLGTEHRMLMNLDSHYRHYRRRADLRHYAASCCAIAAMFAALWTATPQARALATSRCTLEQRQAAINLSEQIIDAL